MADALPTHKVVVFGDPNAPTTEERQQTNWALVFFGWLLGMPAVVFLVFTTVTNASMTAALASGDVQKMIFGLLAVCVTLPTGALPIAAGLFRQDMEELSSLAWYAFILCWGLSAVVAIAFIFAPPINFLSFEPRGVVMDIAEPRSETAIQADIKHIHNRWDGEPSVYLDCPWWMFLFEISGRQHEACLDLRWYRHELEVRRAIDRPAKAAAPAAEASAAGWLPAIYFPLASVLLGPAFTLLFAGVVGKLMTGRTEHPPATTSVSIPTAPPAVANEIQQAFDLWSGSRLQWSPELSVTAQDAYDDFRNWARTNGRPCWTTASGKTPPAFGIAMDVLLRLNKGSSSTSNGTKYIGVGLPRSA
jgi:hypothetical protein